MASAWTASELTPVGATANGNFCGSTSRTSSYLVDLTRDAVGLCACWGSRAGADTNDKDPQTPDFHFAARPSLPSAPPARHFSWFQALFNGTFHGAATPSSAYGATPNA